MAIDAGRAVLWVALSLTVVFSVGTARTWASLQEQTARRLLAASTVLDQRFSQLDGSLRLDGISDLDAPALRRRALECSSDWQGLLSNVVYESGLLRGVVVVVDDVEVCSSAGSPLGIQLSQSLLSAGWAGTEWGPVQKLHWVAADRVALNLASGIWVVGLLHPLALQLPPDGVWVQTQSAAEPIEVVAPAGHRTVAWGVPVAVNSRLHTLTQSRSSLHHGYRLESATSQSAAWAQWAERLPLMLTLATVLGAGGVLLAWRRAVRRARVTERLERALRKRQFEPYVQPIVDLASGRCVGGEVLMRWRHPSRGIVAPGEFIEVAEQTGLIDGMSQLVMPRAALQLAALVRIHKDLYFSFNLTSNQLRSAALPRQLTRWFNGDTLPRANVVLELTERDAGDEASRQAMRHLSAQGWQFAIDDFGTGHSSLSVVEQLPAQCLKIDRAFVQSIGEDTAQRPVLDAVIALGHGLGMKMIAEGIETRSQWDYLAARGVQSAQGYLIARPMPVADFVAWVQRGAMERTGVQAVVEVPAARELEPGRSPKGTLADPLDEGLQALWQRLCSPGGLDIRERMYRLRTYPPCFVGREAVDWIVMHEGTSRERAVLLGRRLLANGAIRHVVDEHDFEDADIFYRVAPSASAPGQALDAMPLPASIAARLLDPASGLRLRSHVRGLVQHRGCASGQAILDALVQTYGLDRTTALHWGHALMQHGRLRHIYDDEPFGDGRRLFRLS